MNWITDQSLFNGSRLTGDYAETKGNEAEIFVDLNWKSYAKSSRTLFEWINPGEVVKEILPSGYEAMRYKGLAKTFLVKCDGVGSPVLYEVINHFCYSDYVEKDLILSSVKEIFEIENERQFSIIRVTPEIVIFYFMDSNRPLNKKSLEIIEHLEVHVFKQEETVSTKKSRYRNWAKHGMFTLGGA